MNVGKDEDLGKIMTIRDVAHAVFMARPRGPDRLCQIPITIFAHGTSLWVHVDWCVRIPSLLGRLRVSMEGRQSDRQDQRQGFDVRPSTKLNTAIVLGYLDKALFQA